MVLIVLSPQRRLTLDQFKPLLPPPALLVLLSAAATASGRSGSRSSRSSGTLQASTSCGATCAAFTRTRSARTIVWSKAPIILPSPASGSTPTPPTTSRTCSASCGAATHRSRSRRVRQIHPLSHNYNEEAKTKAPEKFLLNKLNSIIDKALKMDPIVGLQFLCGTLVNVFPVRSEPFRGLKHLCKVPKQHGTLHRSIPSIRYFLVTLQLLNKRNWSWVVFEGLSFGKYVCVFSPHTPLFTYSRVMSADLEPPSCLRSVFYCSVFIWTLNSVQLYNRILVWG